MNRKILLYIFSFLIAGIVLSCNSDSSDSEPVEYSSSIAVKTFKLSKDDSVVSNLDSVFFTIDLANRKIYNADSLPMGTDVTKLVANITFPVMTSVTLHITDGKIMKDSTINYATNASDSIDFTGNVKLTLVSEDGTETGEYSLKVNVHNVKSDSLYWNRVARRNLPAYTTPIEQKTVEYAGKVNCLIKENTQYLLSTIENPSASAWNIVKVNFNFTPIISSFTATDDALYILSNEKLLYTSTNGTDWNSCGEYFYSIIGGYKSSILAIENKEGAYTYASYPKISGATTETIDEDFPITGSSPLIPFTTQWQTAMQVLMIGGVDKNGTTVGDCWGFDGTNWGKISENNIPATKGAILIPYFTYKVDNRWIATRYTTLLAIGGVVKNEVSKKVYVSYDMGVNWKIADDLLQLPDYIPAFTNAQAIVLPTDMYAARTANEWAAYSSKELPVWNWVIPASNARNYEISWECPYIYLFGGTNTQGSLYNNIWKGVLNRLSFKPLI
ncbi:MAG: DUF6242 domain-containing protein [Muribaculaceae bacterium]|nr:DUF6242 domain-containing protein [Muribaculaceae bacterium]